MKKAKKKKIIIAIVVLVALLLAHDFGPFGGSLRFYSKWIACEQKPVRLAARPGLGWYEPPPSFELARFGYQNYKCTPLEAEQAGYSASSTEWSFPHLPPER